MKQYRRPFPRQLKVLMYHSIQADRQGDQSQLTKELTLDPFAVPAQEFRRQLDLIQGTGYTPVTFKDLDQHAIGLKNLPSKPLILTFDDAYLDFYDVAWPALIEKGWKATLFALGDSSVRFANWSRSDSKNGPPLMNSSQLRELSDNGIEIGSHSLHHVDLTACSIQQAWKEISTSKSNLEEMTGKEVISFSFPFGRQNGVLSSLASVAGYSFACGVYTGPAHFSTDRFNIRRIAIGSKTGPFSYLARLRYPYQHFEYGYQRLIKPFLSLIPQ